MATKRTDHNAMTGSTDENDNLGAQIFEIFQMIGECLLFILRLWWIVGKAIVALFVPTPLKPVKGEIVLITGAGSGIGRELAKLYASEGATVVGTDINRKGLSETMDQISKMGYREGHAYICNMSNREEVLEVAGKIQKEVGNVTILINNAGIMPSHPFMDHTAEEIHRIMDINLMAHFWTLQAFLPDMIKNNHGHIVAISSVAGLTGSRNLVPYCASKFAVRGMMEALLYEFRADPKCQIKTTCIFPYAANTNLFNVDNMKTRFPSLMPVLTAKQVAQHTFDAQRRNIVETTIPRHLLSVSYYFRLLPVEAIQAVDNFFDSFVASDKN